MPGRQIKTYVLSDSALKNSLRIVAGRGSGKSRFLGRVLAWQTLIRRKGGVILDPTGGVTANLVDKISRLPLAYRKQLWPRILYIDVAATDYLVPSPLYTRRPGDTLFAVANRFPEVLRSIDPHLQQAPILGWNSLQECASYAGQIATALGAQIDFVADLIAHPQHYKKVLSEALAHHPELEPAVDYFRQLMDPSSSALRERRTGSFTNKLLPFVADPTMLAAFGTHAPGMDWEAAVAQGQTVIINFENERDAQRRQFKLVWWFRDFIDYVKYRGQAGRGHEVLFLIDEVTQLLKFQSGADTAILTEDLEELVAVLARNYGCNVALAHQDLSQLNERARNVLMGCGTQIVGAISNPDDALYLARQFSRYEPYWVKKREPVWMSVQQFDKYGLTLDYSWPQIIDYRPVEFTPEEQILLAAERFRLPKFQFLMRPATAEGTLSDRLYKLSIENLDRGQYPHAGQVAQVLAWLRQKCGIPLETLLAEIRGRKTGKQEQKQKQMKSEPAPAILDTYYPPPYDATQPLSTDSDTPVSAPPAVTPDGGDRHDSFWK